MTEYAILTVCICEDYNGRKTTKGDDDGGETLKYYSVEQASEILQVTEEIIRIWIRGKRLGA